MNEHHSRARLDSLLTEILNHPDRRVELMTKIEETFAEMSAVMVLDMSGFSRTTHRKGIVHFLVMIHHAQLLCKPIVEAHRGTVVKSVADNLFCLLDTVSAAVAASTQIIARFVSANGQLPSDQHLYASIGIGYGKILRIGDDDTYGDEVNLASKLGEDIADMGEILLTSAACGELEGSGYSARKETASISGIPITYFVIEDKT